MKTIIKRLGFSFISLLKIFDLIIKLEKNSIKFITFHRFHNKGENKNFLRNGLSISDEYLEKIIKYLLQEGYIFISIDEAVEKIKNNEIDKKYIVITIDDGYKDNLTIGYPIFKKYNIPFTIYIATSFLTREMIFWWYIFEDILKESDTIEFRFLDFDYKFNKTNIAELRKLVLDQDKKNYFELMNIIIDKYKIDLSKYHNLALDKKDIEILKEDKLVTIGAHTHNHLSLKSLEKEDIKQEILKSKEILENYGIEIKHFAYPYGSKNEVDEKVINIVKNLGFVSAVTTTKSSIYNKIDLFNISRIIINGNFEHIDYFKLQIESIV